MKHGDLVTIKQRWDSVNGPIEKILVCVALTVTANDIINGVNALKPGVYAFRGYWYGTNPLSHQSYGKIESTIGKVVGKVKSHQQIKKLNI